MYNLTPPDQLPPFLPVSLTFLLSNWFERQTLDQGYSLLQQGKLTRFFMYRHAAAGFIGSNPLTILFQDNQRLEAGFSLQDSHCTLCDTSKKTQRCAHLAALCILSLQEQAQGKYHPLPLLFKSSAWGYLAGFLYTWFKKTTAPLQFTETEHTFTLTQVTETGHIQATLSKLPLEATALLEPDTTNGPHTLFAQLQKRCTTRNEQKLLQAGATSKGLQEDGSLWSRLCTLVFVRLGATKPHVRYLPKNEEFELSVNEEQAGITLSLPLPRSHTVELLKKLDLFDETVRQLPDGRSGYDVSLTPNQQVSIRPIAWLDDMQCMLLSELRQHKFGTHYYVPSQGFIRLAPPKNSATLQVEPAAQASTPLLAFIQQKDEQIVEQKHLPQFLKENQEQLRHPDNRVTSDVLALRYIDIPDSLVLLDLKEQQGWIILSCRFGIGAEQILPSQLSKASKKSKPLTCGLTTLRTSGGPLSSIYQRLHQPPQELTELPQEALCLSRGEFACLLSAIPHIEHQHNIPELQQRLNYFTSLENQSWPDTTIHQQKHLRGYQKVGLSWLLTLYELGMGGILADDMGLGKTHQAMALIDTALQEPTDSPPILVVCPASVLLHWADKLHRFYPERTFALYYGPERNLDTARQAHIILTTYAIARADVSRLSQEDFLLVIYDEIQALKNKNTATHQACRSLRSRAVFGLSGTPIENSLADLFALFSICLPGFFGTFKNFQHSFLTPIEKHNASQQRELLRQRIAPFVLRRTRSQVLTELPKLTENNRSCSLSTTQARLYRETLAAQQPLLADIALEEKPIDYLHVFAMMTRLKQICNHPCLVEHCTDPEQYTSGKWDLFVELLHEALISGRKVVVFSQYLSMLSLIETYLNAHSLGYALLRGDMAPGKRQASIEEFAHKQSCQVFLASLLAGGTGIDLVAGSVVIHYDRWWNPAKEEQATARVHRMGQKEPVDLFRLTTKNTLEEKIDTIIAAKKQLSDTVIREEEQAMIKQFSREELLELFSL